MRPWFITTISSATSMASSWSWVTITVVTCISSVEVAQPGPQLLAHLGVERAEGLIEQQHPRLHRQGPGQGHALSLAAGELGRIAIAEALQLHQLQQLIDAPTDRLVLPAAQLQAKADVLAHGAVLEQGEVLEHKAHLAFLHRARGGLLAGDPDPPRISLFQAGDQSQQGALAGTGGSEQGHQRAGVDIKGDVVDSPEGTELFANTSNADAHDRRGTRTTGATLQRTAIFPPANR